MGIEPVHLLNPHSFLPAVELHSAMKKHLLILGCLLIVLAGCSGPAPALPPVAPSPVDLPVAITLPSTFTPPPHTSTAILPELLPSSTPIPSRTPFMMDAAAASVANVNPLTGQLADSWELLVRRPLVIKITNFPRRVRPQWGLTVADHVYEYYLEDGMTRFIGVFYGHDAERVGPVRSARPFDAQVVRMYKGIFAFAYADDRVIEDLLQDLALYLVVEKKDNCPPLCRIGSENDYNTLFANTAQLSEYISQRGVDNSRQDLNGLRFNPRPLDNGQAVDTVYVRYSRTSHHRWDYNPDRQTYLRFQETESADRGAETYAPLMDSLTGKQVFADNLVILMPPAGYFYHSTGTDIYDYNLIGEGNAYALRDGYLFRVKWKHERPESLLTLWDANGAMQYALKPGNTFFEVLSEVSTYELPSATSWRFIFDLP